MCRRSDCLNDGESTKETLESGFCTRQRPAPPLHPGSWPLLWPSCLEPLLSCRRGPGGLLPEGAPRGLGREREPSLSVPGALRSVSGLGVQAVGSGTEPAWH